MMEQTEETYEKTESKKSPTAWLVKCSQTQKEILQKKAAESGKSVAQFLVDCVQLSHMKEAWDGANGQTQKEFSEIDGLLERLNHLIYAKVYTLMEKEKVAEDLKISLTRKENECTKDYEELKESLVKEYAEKTGYLKTEVDRVLNEERQKFTAEIKQKENECLLSSEKIEALEQKIKTLERDKDTLQKQYTESMRSYEIADERLMELRAKIKELEEGLRGLEKTKARNSELEKEVFKLQVKYDSLAREENIKREYLEKEIRREYKN